MLLFFGIGKITAREHGKVLKKQHFTNKAAQSGHGKQYEMPEFVGFQTMDILVPYGVTFNAVGVFGLVFHLLFKSCSTYYII